MAFRLDLCVRKCLVGMDVFASMEQLVNGKPFKSCVCLLLVCAIAALFLSYRGGNMRYEMRKRKPKTNGIRGTGF